MRLCFRHLVTALLALAVSFCAGAEGPTDPGPTDDLTLVFTRTAPETDTLTVARGQNVSFEVTARSAAGFPLQYAYRLDGTIASTTPDFVFAPSDTGRFQIEAAVTDGERTLTRVWTVSVTLPPNTPPTAVLAIDPASGPAPLAVRLRLTGADPDGAVVRHRVDVTGALELSLDRAAAIDTVITLVQGSYTVTGTVTDDRGASAVAGSSVRVDPPPAPANVAPTVSLTPSSATGDAPLLIHARVVAGDADGTVVSVALDFDGDGGYEASASGAELDAAFTYAREGTYTARAVATDDKGATGSAVSTIVVRRPNASPTGTLTASAASGEAPLAVILSGSGSDPDGNIVKWEIDADDGNGYVEVPAFGSRSIAYPFRPSVFRPRLRLTDDQGARSVIDGPPLTVYRPISAARSSTAATGNPRFDHLSIAPAVWADGSDRLRFTIAVRDGQGEPLEGVPVRVSSLRPDLVVQDGTNLGGTIAIALDGTTTDASGRLTGEVTVNASGRAYMVPRLGLFQSFDLKVEAEAGHGLWRRLPDITGLNAETIVNGNEGVGQFSILPSGLVCVHTPLEIHVRAVRRGDAPGGAGPAGGLVTEIRYSLGGAPLPGLTPAPGYESRRTDANGRIIFRFTPRAPDFRTIKAWVDGQPLNITIGLAVKDC